MSNLTHKIGYRVMALVMAVLMLVGMLPLSTIAYALEETENEAYKAKNFTAVYSAVTDSVEMTWDAFETAPYKLWLYVDQVQTKELDADATSYAHPVTKGGTASYSIKAFVDEADTEGVESERIDVKGAVTLISIPAIEGIEVENNVSMTDIVAQLPAKTKVYIPGSDDTSVLSETEHQLQWLTESANYDQSLTTEQTITIPGVVVLDTTEVQNRDSVSLDFSVEVKVKAASDVAFTSDLDDSAPVAKKVGETLTLSVEASGTAPAYQWFKKDTAGAAAIDGATTATLTIASVALTDAAEYYCVVTGKTGTTATSKTATVAVSKNATSVDLSIDPAEGQTRPQGITLEAIGIPADATGTLIFKEGEDNILEKITLPSSNKTATFKASGTTNDYDFTVIYDAGEDNVKYLGSEKTVNGYGFNKGNQPDPTISVSSNEITYAKGATLTATAVGSLTGNYEFAITEKKDAFGNTTTTGVATIDNTGKITIQAAGTFKVTVKSVSDDDYNESAITTSELITVHRADQTDKFEFEAGKETVTYAHGFSYIRLLASEGTGEGAITYALGSKTTAKGVAVNADTGEITFTDGANDNSTEFKGEVGTVEVVATKAADKWWKQNTASYTITIEKAEQSVFEFADKEPSALTYTENNGTTFTNVIPSGSDKSGWVTVKNAPVYSVADEFTLEGEPTTGVVSVESTSGMITALKSGKATILATLAGNGVYNQTTATYTITVNRGTVEIGVNGTPDNTGFHFEKADSAIKYGYVGFVNAAVGGQTDSNGTITYTDNSEEVTVSANGVITFDKAPAEAATDEYTVTVTATKAATDKYEEQSITYVLTVSRDAVNPATDFKVNGNSIKNSTDLTSADNWYNAEYADITVTPSGNYSLISENGKDWATSIVRDADDNHQLAFYLKDDEGNTSTLSQQTVNFDKTPAAANLSVVDSDDFWSEFLETITFGIWKNESQSVCIEAADNLSGIKSIEYYEQNEGFAETADTIASATFWKSCDIKRDDKTASATVDIELEALTNKKVVVYAKVTDYAGNVSYFRTNGMIFDSISPEPKNELSDPIIDIELSESEYQGLYNDDVPFTVTVNDPDTNNIASGIKTITVTINATSSDGTTHDKTIIVKAKNSEIYSFDSSAVDTGKFEVEGDFSVPADFDSNHVSICVDVTDYADNSNSCVKYLAVDNTDPVIDVTYDHSEFTNEMYIGNNKNRVATITITELNFDQTKVQITLNRDGKPVGIEPNFVDVPVDDVNGDKYKREMKIDYATLGDGVYDFDISCVDKANRSNNGWNGDDVPANKHFVIDNTKPTIAVKITNSDVKNEKYFAADRKATITITERNFSEEGINWDGLTLDGTPTNAITPTLKSSDDKTYVRIYEKLFSMEGDYTFNVGYTDLAGNVAEAYTCTSVAHKEFTIDKTKPALEISGVEHESANNDTVAPVITYSDINLDKTTVSIVLSGVNNGTVNYKGEYSTITNGQTFTYADFERIQKVDDIYILTVTLADMAGNTSEEMITFSANRFGSVYDLSKLKDLNGKYLQTEEDIVFTETNVDSLDREVIAVKLTVNGTPKDLVEGEDFTVEAAGGNGKWSVYTYTIKKSLFANDGRYSIAVYSEDAAGNVNENIDESKEAEISFGIDKTNPVVVPIDFESGVQYAVDSKTVTVEIKDNLVLEGVKIYLNGKEISYTVDGENYTFTIPKSNSKQDVKIVAIDAAGNEEPVDITGFLVNANIFVRWFNNTPLFIGSIVGFVALALAITGFIVFGKKKKEDGAKAGK